MASSLFQTSAKAQIPPMANSSAGGFGQQIQAAAQSAKNMMGILRAAKNPQAAIMQAAQQNPQLGAVMQMCQGRNPQDVFSDECKKHGIDPNQAMQQIQAMLGG